MSLTIGRLHRRTLIGTASLGTLGVAGGSAVLVGAVGASLLTLLWSGRGFHDGERSLTRRWMVHGITAILLVGALLLISSLKIDAVFIILMLGLINRMLLRASSRDDVLIVGGSAVLVTAATVVTSGLGFALLLFAIVPCAAAALWTSTMLASAEHLPSELARLRARPAPRGVFMLGIGALVLTLAGFGASTLLPRYRFTPFLGAGALGSMPGADDSMQLTNDGVDERDSEEVVLRLFPGPGVDQGMTEGLYARLYALDQFDGRTWTGRSGGHHAPSIHWDKVAKTRTGRVQLSRLLKSGYHHPIAVFGRTEPWAVGGAVGGGPNIHYDSSGSMVIDGLAGRAVEYTTTFGEPLAPPTRRGGLAALSKRDGVKIPEGLDPRVRELGERLTLDKPTTDAKIAAVMRHLGTGFTYSTEPLVGTEEDPLVRFLFESKRGHCELYAGAAATLLRVAGIEARVATGYYLGRWNGLGDFLAFSQGDAHAWVEVLAEDGTWKWVDATPESERGRRDESVMRKIRDWYDVVSGMWFDNVVDYDAKRQKAFYMRISRALGGEIDAIMKDPSKGLASLGNLLGGGARSASGWLGVPLLAIAAIAIAVTMRRRVSAEGLGKRLRGALGAEKEENVPLGVLVKRAGRGGEVVALYERLRFAPEEARPKLRDVAAEIRKLEKEKPKRGGAG